MKYLIPEILILILSLIACCFHKQIRKHPKKHMEWPAQEWRRADEEDGPPEWIDVKAKKAKGGIAKESI